MVLAEVLAPLIFWLGLKRFGNSGRAVGVLQGMMVAVTSVLMLWLLVSLFRDSLGG